MRTWDDEAGAVRLPDGRLIRATGLRAPRGPVPPPDFAVYLLASDPGPLDWSYRWVAWRDMWVPRSTHDAVDALREAHRRAAGDRVEIACRGGVGRTGTALALIAVMAGVPADEAVDWVRAHHHPRAVETPWQRAWLRRASPLLR